MKERLTVDEETVVELLLTKLYTIKTQKLSLYSDDEIRKNRPIDMGGTVELEWNIMQIAKNASIGYGVVAKSTSDLEEMFLTLFRIKDLVPRCKKLPKEIMDGVGDLDRYFEILKESQSYMYMRLGKKYDDEYRNSESKSISKEIGDVVRLYSGENSQEYVEYDVGSPRDRFDATKFREDHKEFKDLYDLNRLDLTYQNTARKQIELKLSDQSKMYIPYKESIDNPMVSYGIEYIEEFIIYYDTKTKKTSLTYELLEKRFNLLKFLTKVEVGVIMKDIHIDVEKLDSDNFRLNTSKRRLEYRDRLVGWYPIHREKDLIEVLRKWEVNTDNLEISEYIIEKSLEKSKFVDKTVEELFTPLIGESDGE